MKEIKTEQFYSKAAEAAVLGGMMVEPKIIPEVLEILPDESAFYLPGHRSIFQAIVELHRQGDPVDGLTVREALEAKGALSEVGGPEYLGQILESTPHVNNTLYYAGIVRDKKAERELYVTAEKIRDIAQASGTLDEKINSIRQVSYAFERIKTAAQTKIDVSEFKPLTGSELVRILGLTIKQDDINKLIVFLCQLSAYTDSSQLNISFNAPSATGKSYIPQEIAQLFPESDVKQHGYCSPTAFFHDVGRWNAHAQTYIVDLSRKILIFLDQPHNLLLQHLRPMLSHDKKEIPIKITDKTQKFGLKTKNVLLRGYPAVIFCTAGLRLDEQEATRFLLLSPETGQEKIREAVYEKLKRETDPDGYRQWLQEDPQRRQLKRRIAAIKRENIKQIMIRNPEAIKERFSAPGVQGNFVWKPRHTRDIGRLISLIKCFALLNCWFRQRQGQNIIASDEDIEQGFAVWNQIAVSQEIGLPPYLWEFYQKVILPAYKEKNEGRAEGFEEATGKLGLSRQDIIQKHYEVYGRFIADWQLRQQIIPMLETAGLITQERDPNDRRKTLIYPTAQLTISSEADPDF